MNELQKLEELMFALVSLGGGIRCVEGPFPAGPSLERCPEGANVARHFVLWVPDAAEPDGEIYSRFVSLEAAIAIGFP
ncbi:MAG: hypothetical protein JWO15_3589 [Sphingomonadales bacterium]|nr:hypothetical protein [Sphingomonadales bacterium]